MAHTPTPWTAKKSDAGNSVAIHGPLDRGCSEIVARCERTHSTDFEGNADFVLRACNCFDELLAVAKIGAALSRNELVAYPKGVTNDDELTAWISGIIARAES